MNLPDNPKQVAWAYITQVYARPGVEAACLKLQDNHGINVTFLLFLMWCEETERTAGDSWQNLYRAGRGWRGLARFLRTIRRRAPGQPRVFLLRHEIACEKQQLFRLVEAVSGSRNRDGALNRAPKGDSQGLALSYLFARGAGNSACAKTILGQ